MSLLILDPRSPDREINVYLQPLIEELKQLWSLGVCTYILLSINFFSSTLLCYELLMTFQHMVTYLDEVRKGIRHVPSV